MIEWGVRGKASVLVGGQFGSEGKGLAAAWLAEQIKDGVDCATTNAGAQAGHTTRYRNGRKFICFHLPTTGVVHTDAVSYVNAGSIIDPEALRAEVMATGVKRLIIHPRAAVITPEDRATERTNGSSTEKTASTQKGVGAAIANKIMRRGQLAGEALRDQFDVQSLNLNLGLDGNMALTVEVPQGTGLSLNHGHCYPYTTSRDAYVNSGLADAGIHPSFLGPVCMVVRTLPIRVGDLYNEFGEKIGTSGPFYGDSQELDWAKHLPGVEPERTTVTQRIRRIATWSGIQYRAALNLNRPTIVFLNFCNYLQSAQDLGVHVGMMRANEDIIGVQRPDYVYGFGPCVEDVTANHDEAMAWFERRSF